MYISDPIDLNSIKNSNVLVRVGFDIPNLDSITRIESAIGTIQKLLENGNKLLLITKWGNREEKDYKYLRTTRHLAPVIQKLLDKPVIYFDQLSYLNDQASLKHDLELCKSNVILLENTHFWENENSKIPHLRMEAALFYSKIATYFVDECFISSHRTEATNKELKSLLPWSYGLQYLSEISSLNKFKNPKKPFFLIMGGAKLQTKLPLLHKLLPLADQVFVGGLLCFTLVEASNQLGYTKLDIKNSPVESNLIKEAKIIMEQYGDKIVLPVDFVWLENKAMDLGSDTISLFKSKLETAKSLFWNGPLGYYEDPSFRKSTLEIAGYITTLQNCYKLLGGGDTDVAIPCEIANKFDFVSKGGGATLEYLSQ